MPMPDLELRALQENARQLRKDIVDVTFWEGILILKRDMYLDGMSAPLHCLFFI